MNPESHLFNPPPDPIPVSDLDRLGLILGLTESDLHFLLDLEHGLTMCRLTFERWTVTEIWRERRKAYNRRYYQKRVRQQWVEMRRAA